MKRTLVAALACALLLLSSSPHLAATETYDLRIGDYVLVGKTRIGPYLWHLSYRASLTNRGTTAIDGATAEIRTILDWFIVDGTLTFGPVAPGRTVTSSDTFTLRSPFGQTIDARLLDRSLRWKITIASANAAPVAAAGADHAVLVGETVTLDGTGSSDADGDPLTFAWTLDSKPAGSQTALSDPSVSRPTFVPDVPGDYVVSLTVGDGRAMSAPDSATVTASAPPQPPNHDPQITSLAPTTGAVGAAWSYQVVAIDTDGDPLSYALGISPAGMTIGAGGLVAWTPDHDGRFNVRIDVSDGRGGTALQSFSIDVAPPAGVPPPTVEVDPTVPVQVTQIPGQGGDPARAVLALTDRSNIPMHFVANELIVVSDDIDAVNDLANRYGGILVRSFVPSDYGLPGSAQHLLRIDPSTVDTSGLVEDLVQLEPAESNALRVSSDAGLRLLAAAAHESAAGGIVSLNAVGTGAGFEQSTTTEHSDLEICKGTVANPPVVDGCVPFGIAGSEQFYSDAYRWSYMMVGGAQNIGVGAAWRSLSLAGLLGNKVKIAVIDGGFAANATDNPLETEYDDNDIFAQDGPIPNEGRCFAGALCPYHGANVVSAAMGPADDRMGAAGPGGPVATALEVRTASDNFSAVTAFGVAFSRGARIINMSFGGRYPATMSWQAEPFNLITTLAAAAGTLIVAASGNDSADIDSEDCVPITGSPCWEDSWWWPCENDGVLCVGALNDNATTRASISNYGAEDVHLYAPGAVWVGSDPSDVEPKLFTGTSASAPFVSGVAALVIAANPGLRGPQVADYLLQTAWQLGDPAVPRYINALGAVNLALGGSPVCTAPQIQSTTPDHSTAPCLENVFEVTHSQAFGPFRYQWRKIVPATDGRVDLADGGRFAGVTTARMSINPFRPEDEGRYDVVVSNLCGSTTSAPINVTLVAGRVERAPSLLQPRSQVGMAFDRGRGRMVLYGGQTPSFFDTSSETWERDATGAWQIVTNQGPGPRFDAFMEYDEARGVTVLFGGRTCTQLACPVEQFDTWEWNGTTWTERPSDPVSTRSTRSTLYDPVRRRVVRIDVDFSFFEWDGTAWTRRVTSPDPVDGSPILASTNNAVAFDRNRNVYVLKSRTDTWERTPREGGT